jgi:23S rRNA (adenine2503-C2)-methyltransferase
MNTLDLSKARLPKPAVNLSGLTRKGLVEALIDSKVVEPRKAKMRMQQLWGWIHHHGMTDFEGMTDISKDLRAQLSDHFTLKRPEIVARQISADGTRKYLIRMGLGIEVETVYIPDVARSGALCVSSQVGCTLNCSFCHTGTQKLVRNLTAAEIVAQVQVVRDDLGEWPTPMEGRLLTNIVFMGMGEPLYNLDHVADAIDIISDNEGIAISRRRITVSTSGVVPELKALGERCHTMLAISLHAPSDSLRDILVPLNKKYPIKMLIEAIKGYSGLSNSRRVTFEYVMLKGINDSLDDARALVGLLRSIPSKINLIPFNPWPGTDYECSDWETIEAFGKVLNRAGFASPIRRPRGRDILAACGQLKSDSEKMRASERTLTEGMDDQGVDKVHGFDYLPFAAMASGQLFDDGSSENTENF